MVDLTRDGDGQLHARLLDVVPGRSGVAYADWLKAQAEMFVAGIEHAAPDPFRGYANAIRDARRRRRARCVPPPQARHASRRRSTRPRPARPARPTQPQERPLYKIRGLLRHGHEHLTARELTRLDAGLRAGEPN